MYLVTLAITCVPWNAAMCSFVLMQFRSMDLEHFRSVSYTKPQRPVPEVQPDPSFPQPQRTIVKNKSAKCAMSTRLLAFGIGHNLLGGTDGAS